MQTFNGVRHLTLLLCVFEERRHWRPPGRLDESLKKTCGYLNGGGDAWTRSYPDTYDFSSESHLASGLKHDGRHWHWKSADRVVTGHDPIEMGLGLPHPY